MKTIRIVAMVLVPLLGACSTSGRTTGSRDLATVVVENNLAPPAQVTVYAVSSIGSQERVGIVAPGTTRSLRFSAGVGSGQIRLIARADGGQQVTSQPIPLQGGQTVRWSLFANNIDVP